MEVGAEKSEGRKSSDSAAAQEIPGEHLPGRPSGTLLWLPDATAPRKVRLSKPQVAEEENSQPPLQSEHSSSMV